MNGIKFLLPLAIAFAALPEGRIAAGGIRHTATGPTSTVVSGGVRIVTSMARAAYPSRALVEVRIRVKNVSSNNIEMSRSACGNAIQAQVLDRKGQVLYPPALPFFPPSCGPHVPPTTLPPGGHLGARAIVILRGRSVRAVVNTTTSQIFGKAVNVKTVMRSPEHMSVSTNANGGYAARVWPWRRSIGRFRFASYESCSYKDGSTEASGSFPGRWSFSNQSTLTTHLLGTQCARGEQWHIVGGWLGYPVARLDLSLTNT